MARPGASRWPRVPQSFLEEMAVFFQELSAEAVGKRSPIGPLGRFRTLCWLVAWLGIVPV